MPSFNHRFVLFWLSLAATLITLANLYLMGGRESWFAGSAYYFVLATLVLALSAARRAFPEGPDWRRLALQQALPATVVIGVIFLVIEPRFRILADETNLLSTSFSLFYNQELMNIRERLFYYDQEHVVSAVLAHRPALFSVLTSLLHSLFGFQWYHGFVLNFLVGVASLVLFYRFGERAAGPMFGILCAALLAAFPIFQLNITSSGFDALNMLMLALTYALLYRFVLNPSAAGLELLLLVSILTAQARYESMAVLLPVAVVALLHWRSLRRWRYSLYFPLIPLLSLPILWQKILSDEFANSANSEVTAFAIERIWPNLVHLAEFFIDWNDRDFASQRLIAVLALAGLVWWGAGLWRARDRRLWIFALSLLLGYALILVSHLSYQYGDLRLAWINRLTQVHLVWMAPAAACALWRVYPFIHSRALLVLLLAVIWSDGLSTSYRDPLGKSLHLQREFNMVRNFVQQRFPPESTLLISDKRANMYAALGYSAVGTGYANLHMDTLKENLRRGLFQTILYLEDRRHSGGSSRALLHSDAPRRELFAGQYKADGSIVIHQLQAPGSEYGQAR